MSHLSSTHSAGPSATQGDRLAPSVELVLSKADAERMEALRSEAWVIRNEIRRLVFSGQGGRHRARLGELRGRYFGLLERIDRVKRLWPTSVSDAEADDDASLSGHIGTIH